MNIENALQLLSLALSVASIAMSSYVLWDRRKELKRKKAYYDSQPWLNMDKPIPPIHDGPHVEWQGATLYKDVDGEMRPIDHTKLQ